jgi:uncharacterized protein
MFFDPLYLLFTLPALALGLWAQYRVKSTFNEYSTVRSMRGITGAQAARMLLDRAGLGHVDVEHSGGLLSDHYDPSAKVLRLSDGVFNSNSVAALGVAAHEAGHALQDQQNYAPLRMRSALVPAVQFGSWLGPIIFMAGYFMQGIFGSSLAWLGVLVFAAAAIFALVTLPVEFDASRRAKQELVTQGILGQQEMVGVNKVLDAAALTYVAAAIQALSTLLYYVYLLIGRRDE